MIADVLAFALIGLIVGAGAVLLLSRLFTQTRGLTVTTALAASVLIGLIAHAVLGGGHLAETAPIAALGSVLLVSVLARPRPVDRRTAHARTAPRTARQAPGRARRTSRHPA